MRQVFFLFCLALTSMISLQNYAQSVVQFKSKDSDTMRVVYIWHSDTLRESKKDSFTTVQSLFGHVKLQQERTLFNADSVAINQKDNTVEAFGNVHINDADTTNIYSQYMKYYVDKKYIIFQKKVTLTDGKGVLTTEDLQYDLNLRIGNYTSGGKVVDKQTVVTSKDGTYYAETKDVYFKRDVVLKDPAYDLAADSLLYNTDSQLATFITETHIRDSSGRTVHTKEGFYDLKNHKAQFGKRSKITDGSQSIIADSIQFDDSTGINIAKGNAVVKDTSEGTVVIANIMISNKRTNTLLATDKPLLIIKQDNDSIYVRADTLYSGVIPDSVLIRNDSLEGGSGFENRRTSDSSHRYMQGFHHVRIYSDSMQAVADSMYYSGMDSIFRLFTNPIAWAGGYQVTGDTMFLYTKNKKPDQIYVWENALVVGKSGEDMYNQVKGITLHGYFKNGEIDYMRAKGNAESVYYIKDDSLALVGVNRVTRADVIDMIFQNKELNKVVLRNDAEGTMYPIRKANIGEMKLRNFKWLDERRPKTKFELFED
ncbi:MAG TPA: OstA-like protein [Puia sp.]|nr:OstA-like protein [Puia sp.]